MNSSIRDMLETRPNRGRPVSVDAELAAINRPPESRFAPVRIEPSQPDIDLAAWVGYNRARIEAELLRYGAVLFRGFSVRSATEFWAVVDAHKVELMHYAESATPRVEVGDRLYTSTEFPADQTISLHNENSSAAIWPMKLWFYCEQTAQRGGETSIADVRRVLARIPDEVRDMFARKGWAVVRNYGDGVGLPWRVAFNTNEREEVERYCALNEVERQWKDENRLRTIQRRPAIRTHPATGESVWFNHMVFWHPSSLDPVVRRTLEAEFDPLDLPYSTFFGDLSPIHDDVVAAVREAYDAETIAEPWQVNDVLLVDNMLVAHGRRPFEGKRRVLVMMGQPSSVPPMA
ncbi:TauD/TfdA family dioxygenase [Bradyrhizobium sp.]